MKILILPALLLTLTFVSFGQNEQAPIKEESIKYKDWTYKSIRGDESINLREFVKDKKLVLVLYFAPWCSNWKHEAPFAQKLYEKYKSHGFAIIGVGEYDTVEAMKTGVDSLKITFPVVYESDSKYARQNTTHYDYRVDLKDTRNWGSPWNIFLIPDNLKEKGDVITKKAFVSAGELIEIEAEKFVREKLGLPPENTKAEVPGKPLEVCAEDTSTAFKKP